MKSAFFQIKFVQYFFMKVTSKYFKKEFDLSKGQLVGQGNFAQVYRIFDPEINDSLAIRKVDRDQGESDDIEKQRIINEELKKVQNQNILQIYDIIQTPTSVWYITQFCEGGSLWDALNAAKDNKMTEKDGLQCVLQVSKGVQELHNHRITHRDLKPENILLKTKYIPGKALPTIKIADFGLSTKKIIMETVAGTKEYIAPEQARFHNYTNAVDVWSLGIIFDEILHGNPFYIGDNNKQVFQKIIKTPYKVRDESLRASIKQFLISLLKKKPYERPIIAVIRQNLEKILDEIYHEEGGHRERQKTTKGQEQVEKQENNGNKQNKKDIVPLAVHFEEPKREEKKEGKKGGKRGEEVMEKKIEKNFLTPQFESESSINESMQEGRQKKKRFERTDFQKKQQVKQVSKTPFKRQNTAKNQIKTEEEINSDQNENKLGRVPLRQQGYGKAGNSGLKQQKHHDKKPQSNEKNTSPNQMSSIKTNQKVTIYKVDPRKKPVANYQKKDHVSTHVIETKQYVKQIMKMKEGLTKNTIELKDRRQFLPNPHLNTKDMPAKVDPDQFLKSFRQKYDYLNYFSVSDDYQIKIAKGRREMQQKVTQAKNELSEYKQKLKEGFLSQIDHYVDLYFERNVL